MQQWTEAAIAAALEGKFFTLNGRDIMGEAREREAERVEAVTRARDLKREQVIKAIRKSQAITAANILLAVSLAHDIPVTAIVSKARAKKVIVARHHAVALMGELTGMSTTRIAEAVNLADHSTVVYAQKTWGSWRGATYRQQDTEARRMMGIVA